MSYLRSTLGFVHEPKDLFERHSHSSDFLVMDRHKMANDYGCEHGGLDRTWALNYDSQHYQRGGHWKMRAAPLLWLQITMLDTLIARHIDALMLQPEQEIAVPVDEETAWKIKMLPCNSKSGWGWKGSRCRFAISYIRRLADESGWQGDPRRSESMGRARRRPYPVSRDDADAFRVHERLFSLLDLRDF